jgi:ATP-dependent RNA helicase RhlE
MTFNNLGLSPTILSAVAKEGYTTPTPIQAEAIPQVLKGHDIMAAAQTGTGKTAAFVLPMLERLSWSGAKVMAHQTRALVLTPTRELAAQVKDMAQTYGNGSNIRVQAVFGGVAISPQVNKLRHGVDILVATPGRLLDLYNQKVIRFRQLEMLVLDEADRMLDMGFIHDIKKILKLLPENRQNLLFSATFSPEIRKLARTFIHNPIEISVTPPNSTVDLVQQKLYKVEKEYKADFLIELIKKEKWKQVLVFTRTKYGADKLTKKLNKHKIGALAIHGNKSQGARTKALAQFKAGEVQVLAATDIAARGIDIDLLPYVVNFDLPSVPEDYVHRIGRTGRAGANGVAVSLFSPDEHKQLRDIEKLINKKIEVVGGVC